jgi:hypothetical protein
VADERAQLLIKRWDHLFSDLQLWTPTWQEINELMMPRKSNIQLQRSPGSKQTEKLMDSTPIHSVELLAASMQGSLTSGSVRWFFYRIRGLALGVIPDADKWLEDASLITYDELRESNFSSEAHEFYIDLSTVGTAAIFIDEKKPMPNKPFAGLRFQTLVPGTYVIDENEEGRVDTLMYKFKLSARNAKSMFGEENLPDRIKKNLDPTKGNPDQEFDFIHAIFPRRSVPKGYDASGDTPKNRPFASMYVAMEDQVVLKEGGFHEFPFAVARWTKTSGEKYGRSPGYTALPDAKTLNKLRELKLRAMAVMVQPPLKIRDDGVLGTPRLIPGGLTHVRDMDAVEPLQIPARVDVANMEEDKLQAAIRRIFFSDQLQLQEGPQMTAYEVQVRYELMQRILGPTLGRLETEFLEPLVERVFNILMRRKRFLPMPPALVEYRKMGGAFDIEYEGPLARAQRLSETVAIQRFLQLVVPMAEFQPDVLDIIDVDKTVQTIAIATGVPPSIIHDQETVDAKRNERKQAQAQQAQAAQAQETMKAVGGAAPALKALMEAQKSGILPAGGAIGAGVPTGGIGA